MERMRMWKLSLVAAFAVILFASNLEAVYANSIVNGTSTKPIMPPFDPTKVKNVNMTEVNAIQANNPLSKLRLPHGTPLSNSTTEYSGTSGGFSILDFANHEAFGTYTYHGTDIFGHPYIMGLEAMNYVNMSLFMPSDTVLYAPTLRHPDPSPIEVTTVYPYPNGGGSNYVGVWNWNLPANQNFNASWSFDWMNDNGYFNTYQGQKYYNVVIFKDTQGRWGVFFYHFTTGLWDEMYAESNNHNGSGDGWDAYEAYWTGTWPSTPFIDSSNQEIYYLTDIWGDYTWSLNYAMLGYSSGTAIDDSWLSETHGWNAAWYDWYVGPP